MTPEQITAGNALTVIKELSAIVEVQGQCIKELTEVVAKLNKRIVQCEIKLPMGNIR